MMNKRRWGIIVLAALIGIAVPGCRRPAGAGNASARTVKPEAGIIPVEMVRIPAGTFTMGSPADEPGWYEDQAEHEVTLSAFYLGKYPVTQEQYEAVMGTNPSWFTASLTGGDTAKHPVEQVSWYDAIVFCNRLSMAEGLSPAYRIPRYNNAGNPDEWGAVPENIHPAWEGLEIVPGSNGYRLPTEAQWEYACRAGTTTAYNTGAYMNDDTGWFQDNSGMETHEAGTKAPNAWGLYDMHGNVFEWCWDWFGDYPDAAQTDPSGPLFGENRVIRGGGWLLEGRYLRSAYRSHGNQSRRDISFGFRLARP